MVPAQCLERVVKVLVPGGQGTGFVVPEIGAEWLVTARHVVENVDPSNIQLEWHGSTLTTTLVPLAQASPGADVQVYKIDLELWTGLPLTPSADNVIFSQDLYFLGYPYGLGIRSSGVTQYPFVKKGILSASDVEIAGVRIWMIDGINNPGFSGGPVVFQNSGTSTWQVLGVVSGYRTEHVAIAGGSGTVPTNTGIIVAYDIKHAIDAIELDGSSR